MLRVLSIFFVTCFVTFESFGMSVIPFIHNFDPDEKEEQTTQYYIGNDTDDFMAFMLSIHRRYQKNDGSDRLEKDENSFIVMPSQIIIPPHSKRIVKVKWIGNDEYKNNPKIEQAYRLCIDQFPIKVKLEKKKSNDDKEQIVMKMPKEKRKKGIAQIQVSYKIWTSLYATPKDSSSDMVVERSDAQSITIRNNGTRHGELRQIKDVMCDGKPIKEWFDDAGLEKVVLAGSSRKFPKWSKSNKKGPNKKPDLKNTATNKDR